MRHKWKKLVKSETSWSPTPETCEWNLSKLWNRVVQKNVLELTRPGESISWFRRAGGSSRFTFAEPRVAQVNTYLNIHLNIYYCTTPHNGPRPFHQKSTYITQSILRPYPDIEGGRNPRTPASGTVQPYDYTTLYWNTYNLWTWFKEIYYTERSLLMILK